MSEDYHEQDSLTNSYECYNTFIENRINKNIEKIWSNNSQNSNNLGTDLDEEIDMDDFFSRKKK